MSWPEWGSNIPLPATGNPLSSDMGNFGPMNTMGNMGPLPLMQNAGNMGNIMPNMGNMPNMVIPNMSNMPNLGNMPNMGNMPNTGNVGPDQWNAVQTAQWQQWTQWQQQYAQWHSQYGQKYAQQMQMGGGFGSGMVGAPAPPPPDKPPPPPPPHENDLPLYANNTSKPSPPASSAPMPSDQSHHYRNSNVPIAANNQTVSTTGNETNWAPPASTPIEGNVASANSDALTKLAEEKRLFDIQFKKWEQEIETWKRENVNHPDKKAYKEYQDKFEACRAQLLERRQQMDVRKATLMGTFGQTNAAAAPANSQSSKEIKSSENNTEQNCHRNSRNSRFSDAKQQENYNNKNSELQDKFSSYENSNNINVPVSYTSPQSSNFLTGKGMSKGIPGLDLVPESDKNPITVDDVVDITQEKTSVNPLGPDYSRISKGIDSILGDEKIMNILSLVRDQGISGGRVTNQQTPQLNNMNFSVPPNQLTNTSNYNKEPPHQPQNREWPHNRGNNSYDSNMNNQMPYDQYGNNDNQNMNRFENQQQGNYQDRGGQQRLLPRQQQRGPQGNQLQAPQGNQHPGPWGNQQQGPWDNQEQGLQGNRQQGPQGIRQQGPQGNRQQGPQGNRQQGPQGNRQQGPEGFRLLGPQGNRQQGPQGIRQQGPQGNRQQGPQGNRQQGPQGNLQQGSQGNRQQGPQGNRQLGPQGNRQQGPQGNRQQGPQGNQQQGPLGNQQQGPLGNQRNMQGNVNMMGQQFQKNNNTNAPLLQKPQQNQMPHQRNFQDDEYYDDGNNYNQQEYSDNEVGNRANPNVPIRPKGSQRPPQNMMQQQQNQITPAGPKPPSEPAWDDGLFVPSIIVDYGHKQLRLKARDFIEPVQTFDYNHKSKDDDERRRDYKDVATRRSADDYHYFMDRNGREPMRRDPIRREPLRDDWRRRRSPDQRYSRPDEVSMSASRPPIRESHSFSHRNWDNRDNRDRRSNERFDSRDDSGRDSTRNRSRDRDTLKRSNTSTDTKSQPDKKQSKSSPVKENRNIYMINDLLESPGREVRPQKIAIILRGPPGSGKSYLAKLIRDKEAEYDTSMRIMSIDDYFTQDTEVEEKDPATGKMVKKTISKYEYDSELEPKYIESLKKSFKKTLSDGYHSFVIYDAVNPNPESYFDVWFFAKKQHFQVYVCSLEMDPQTCSKRNIHNRSLESIKAICDQWEATPNHHMQLDPTGLLQNASITDVTMEDVDNCVIIEDDDDVVEVEVTSKWEKMDDAVQLARLDGTSKPLRATAPSMEDYLQLDDWRPTKAKPGKKTVRWADIEERRQQEKMRAIGFVVGQTDWNRMTDPTMGSSALTKTKYIERVSRK